MARGADHSWDVVAYEVRMFRATYEIVLEPDTLKKLRKVWANAVEESAVLHTRILCEVFLSRGIDQDDIQVSKLFPAWDTDNRYDSVKQSINRLRRKYGSAQRSGSPCWIFNKMMAHPTAHRGKSYDYTAILADLEPILQDVIADIERLRGRPFTWTW
jgi:hypothetical protein